MTFTDVDIDAPVEFERSVPFTLERSAPDGDGLTFEGYAAVFDSPTTIDSWEGNFVESISRGAFRKTLREQTPVLMFDHGQHPLIGSMPLGVITRAKEDGRGLFVQARLHDNWLIEPVRDAVQEGSVTGMSFRFRAIKDSWDRPAKGLPVRTLLEVSVAELGPVVFPAYASASSGIRQEDLAECRQAHDSWVKARKTERMLSDVRNRALLAQIPQ